MRAAALFAFGLAAASAAVSQTLPQVTVSATRSEAAPFDVPASVDVIDGARLRAAGRPEINLSESLALVPGGHGVRGAWQERLRREGARAGGLPLRIPVEGVCWLKTCRKM